MHYLLISCALVFVVFSCLSLFGWNQHLKSDDEACDAHIGI